MQLASPNPASAELLTARKRAPRLGGRTSVFVLIDALGWALLDGQDFLRELLPYQQQVRTVLGFSSGAIPTILTGVPPERHGHWNLYYYDPEASPFRWLRRFTWLPELLLDNRLTRKVLKEMGRHVLGLGPQFECHVSPRALPWFNFVEKKSIYKPGGISGAPSIFDDLAKCGQGYRVYTYHEGSDAELVRWAIDDLRRQEAKFLFLYLSEFDAFLHEHCQDSTALERNLKHYARQLERLFQAALVADPDATLAVFSDHGMTPVQNHFDLVAEIDRLGFRIPRDYLAVFDSTMARFWFFRDGARQTIENRLRQIDCGHILEEEELRRLGIFFSDRRYGELIFLLDPGWLLTHSDFNGKGWMPKGMHGYDPADRYSDAVFLTNRAPRAPITHLADVYHVLLESAGEC